MTTEGDRSLTWVLLVPKNIGIHQRQPSFSSCLLEEINFILTGFAYLWGTVMLLVGILKLWDWRFYLCITVSCAVFGTGFVGGVFRKSSISWHLGEVERSVKPARQIRNIHIKSEFLTHELEHLIFSGTASLHQVGSRSNIGVFARCSHKLEFKGITRGCNAIVGRIISSFQSTVWSTCLCIRACGSIPSVASVAVGVVTLNVEPSPVRVENDWLLGCSATSSCWTLAHSERWMSFCRVGPNKLGTSRNQKGREGKNRRKHDEWLYLLRMMRENLRRRLQAGLYGLLFFCHNPYTRVYLPYQGMEL